MHIAAIYFIQRQIAAQNRYNKRSYKKQVFTWRTISFLHEHLLFYLFFTAGINSGSQVFITDPTINPTLIYNNPVRHIAAIAAFPYDDTVGDIIHFFIICLLSLVINYVVTGLWCRRTTVHGAPLPQCVVRPDHDAWWGRTAIPYFKTLSTACHIQWSEARGGA